MVRKNTKLKRTKKAQTTNRSQTRSISRAALPSLQPVQLRSSITSPTYESRRSIRTLASNKRPSRVSSCSPLSRRSFSSATPTIPSIPARTLESHVSLFPTTKTGEGTSYRIHFFKPGSDTTKQENMISPWHDIPLFNPGETFNYVNEIPKNTRAKYEIDTKAPHNPIKQDTSNNDLRFFKYGNLPFNYGALPQTWEDPLHIDPHMKLGGDNDPLDVVELSPAPLEAGHVYKIKIIGVLALIDEDEVDWKLLGIHVEHPLAGKLDDITNLEAVLPGAEHRLKEWFRMYKTPDGKPENKFGFKDRLLNREFAYSIIEQTHDSWKKLREFGYESLWTGTGADGNKSQPRKIKLDGVKNAGNQEI